MGLGRRWLSKREKFNELILRHSLSQYILLVTLALAGTLHFAVWWNIVGISVLNMSIAVLIWAVVNDSRSTLSRVLNSSVARTLGVWSYGIYLWQQPLTIHRKAGLLSVFPINVAIVICIACAGYYLIERRMQVYGRRLAAGLDPRRVVEAQPEIIFAIIIAAYCGVAVDRRMCS